MHNLGCSHMSYPETETFCADGPMLLVPRSGLLSRSSTMHPCFGTFMAYRSNGGATGVDFAARYFSISIVVTVRYMVYLIPVVLGICFSAFYALMQGSSAEQALMTDGVEVVLLTLWYSLIYWSIARNIRDVARA